jgi:phosphomannomutase
MRGHTFHPTVLRRYDIRGIVGETLSAADAEAIGRAFGAMIRRARPGGTVCVGRDGRLSSPELEAAVVAGLCRAGVDVARVGCGPSPLVYFAQKHLDAAGAIMVTGSHNPPAHNGFKMMLDGRPFFGDDIRRLGELAAAGVGDDAPRAGAETDAGAVAEDYLAALLGGWRDGGRPLTAVWDPGNGAAGALAEALAARLPGRHIVINGAIDGTFPNHHPDPTEPHTLEQLRATVAEVGADIGLAFDGDGDRLGVIDGRGRILWGDQILILLAEEVLAERPGAPIIADVKASQLLFDRIAALGGRPIVGATGHSLIKTLMAETGAPLAGEMSGHLFFADRYFGFDDGLYAAVRVLSLVAGRSGSLADWFDTLPKPVNTPELRFPCPDEAKAGVIEQVRARLKAEGAAMSEVDGVRVTRPSGWWLLRASNTQAVLVARAEAGTEADLAALRAELAGYLAGAGVALPDG